MLQSRHIPPAQHADTHPGDVLTERLDQLRNETWMRPVLEAALQQLIPAPVRVEGYQINYCKIKPRRDINVALEALVRRGENGGLATHRLSCTVYATPEAARAKFAEEGWDDPPATLGRRLQKAGFERPAAVVADPPIIVRVFPADPVLTALEAVTNVDRMKALFADHVGCCREDGRRPQGLTYDVLHYKPRRSCTFRYEIDLDRGLPQTCSVYGKVYRDDRGDRCHQLLDAAWQASCAGGHSWRAARPVVHIPEWRFVVQEAVPGRQFRHVFAELTHDRATEAELDEVRGYLRAVARAVRGMQRSAVRIGPRNDFKALIEGQERNLAYLARTQAELAVEIGAIRRDLIRLERELPAQPLVFAHGDFAHGNVLVDGDRVGIIDFDRGGQAEPAYDVAFFLTHMWSFGIRHPRRQPHVRRLTDQFRQAYLELAPEVSSERLALYEALDFSAYVLRNFRKQSHQANWLAWARYQVEAAWNRLGVAAGAKGATP